MSWVGWFVRWFALPLVPLLMLLSYTGFQLEGQFENLLGSASSTVLNSPGSEERLFADVERLGGLAQLRPVDAAVEQAAIEALVETDGFRAAVSDAQREVGAAWDKGENAVLAVDLSSAIDEASLEPAIADELREQPVLTSEPIERPRIKFGQMGWLAAFGALSFAVLGLFVSDARQAILYAMGLLAVYAPVYVWGLHHMASADDLADGAIGLWLQARLTVGLYVATAVGIVCFLSAHRSRESAEHLLV